MRSLGTIEHFYQTIGLNEPFEELRSRLQSHDHPSTEIREDSEQAL